MDSNYSSPIQDAPATEVPGQKSFLQRLGGHLHWFEILLALWSLALAAWQLVRFNSQAAGFVAIWMIPPAAAVGVRFKPGSRGFVRAWAIMYLAALSAGDIFISNPEYFP